MKLSSLLSVLGLLASQVQAHPALLSKRSNLGLPFKTDNGKVVTSDGKDFIYQGTNWPGHMNAMVPEGLQYSSVKDIVKKIKGFGLNSVRLTFAIELVDQIYEKGHDTNIEDSFKTALGDTNGAKILSEILKNNPQFSKETTRLEVYNDVAKELANQGIYLHLDNHVSKAFWCCSSDDGNGFFGEKYFNVTQWIRGWKYMAKHADENFPSWASVGLRNELRSVSNPSNAEPYDWYTWYQHMTAAANAVHSASTKPLLFFSGLNFDTYIQAIPLNQALKGTDGTSTEGKTAHFDPNSFDFKDKIVLELHKYDGDKTQQDCKTWDNSLYSQGFQAVNPNDPDTKYTFPVVLTEFGFAQDGHYYKSTTYSKCLIDFVGKYKVGWLQWDLCGSYYTKWTGGNSYVQDSDEAWGLLNHDWSGTRSQVTFDNSLKKMIEAGNN
ncbi:tRNA-dihydrouridine synthase 3 [Ascosphaera pollenicola]|nr:tRNA-dihydrouridine synthase 3 [Ascosphaera pollenicola]